MKKELPLSSRIVSTILLIAFFFTSFPLPLYAAVVTPESQNTKNGSSGWSVKPNRTVPKLKSPKIDSPLPKNPSDDEVFAFRNLSIPLIPDSRPKNSQENQDLAVMLNSYLQSKGDSKISLLESFLESHPLSRWEVSLCYNLGHDLFERGYFTRALQRWNQGWNRGKDSSVSRIRSIADACFGESLKMNCRVGRFDVVSGELQKVQGRIWSGAANELVAHAIEAVGAMKRRPDICFMCGPFALRSIAAHEKNKKWNIHPLNKAKSTSSGFNLEEIERFSKECKMPFAAAKRQGDAPIPLPAVVHWKLDHYGAILAKKGDRYLLKDPTFGHRQWISKKALDEESSGYYLINTEKGYPQGWSPVEKDLKKSIFGKGNTNGHRRGPGPDDNGGGGPLDKCKGMPEYDVIRYDVSLLISDEPVVYPITFGPEISFKVNYIQREDSQPVIFDYFNFGDKWMSQLVSYVKKREEGADVIQLGGGVRFYEKISEFEYKKPCETRDQLAFDGENDQYVVDKKDGSSNVYGLKLSSSENGTRYFITKMIDAQGIKVEFQYDDQFRLRTIKDGAGFVSTLGYGVPNDPLKVSSITDPFGRTALFQYQGENLVAITDALGLRSDFKYQGSDIVRMITPYGVTSFQTTHTEQVRALVITNPVGERERYEVKEGSPDIPFSTGSKPSVSGFAFRDNYMNYRNTFYWDKKQYVDGGNGTNYSKAHVFHWLHTGENYTGATLESEKAPLESRIYYRYEGQGDNDETAAAYEGSSNNPTLVARISPSGGTQYVQYSYNSKGNITSSVDPAGRTVVFSYYPNEIDLQAIRQKNGAGYDTLREFGPYYPQHIPSYIKEASGQITHLTYTLAGKVKTVTNPKGELSEFTYDANQNLIQIQRNGRIEKFGYDNFNHLTSYTSPDNDTILYQYDQLDHFLKATYPDGTTEEKIYERLEPIWQKDRLGRWTRFYYDQQRRISVVQDPQGGLTQLEWCICGSPRSLTDSNGNRTEWHHDLQSRLVEKTFADGTKESYEYDSIGRLSSIKDAMGQTKKFTYRIDNMIQELTYLNAVNPTPSLSFTYDTIYPRLASRTDGIGTTQWTYHSAGQNGALQIYEIDGPWNQDTIKYQYDALGRVISRSIGEVEQTLELDSLGRALSTTNPLGTFTYGYDAQTSRVASILYPNGQKMLLQYETSANNRLLKSLQNLKGDDSVLSKFDYHYNSIGNMIQWDQQLGGNPQEVWKTSYDLLNQLTQVRVMSQGNIIRNEEWTYDKSGNRLSSSKDGLTRFYQVNHLNQISNSTNTGKKVIQGRLTRPGNVTVQGQTVPVDANNRFSGIVSVTQGTNTVQVVAQQSNGNTLTNNYQVVVSGPTSPVTLTYDLNGNLLSDGEKTYEWDAENRLVKIQKGSDIWEFSYNGAFERVQEKKNGSISKRWLWAKSNQPVQERDSSNNVTKSYYSLGYTQGSSKYYYTKDHLGSIREISDESQNIRARYIFDAWGNRTKSEGDLDADFGYTGHLQHESGLILTLYRGYNSNIGRWISKDPIKENGGINLYSYCLNNPTNVFDTMGLAGDTKLPLGYTARVDSFNIGGKSGFETHVHNPSGTEIGVLGPDGWINKHGHNKIPELPIEVRNALNGINVKEARLRGMCSLKGKGNIAPWMNKLGRFAGDMAMVLLIYQMLSSPTSADAADIAVDSITGLVPPSTPEERENDPRFDPRSLVDLLFIR